MPPIRGYPGRESRVSPRENTTNPPPAPFQGKHAEEERDYGAPT